MTGISQDDDLLAAEYVLGTLALDERLGVEARIRTDAPFAAAVDVWQARLQPLNDATPILAPSPDLLARIEARLFARPARRPWHVRLWAGLATGLAAVILAVVLLTAPPPPTLVATLAPNASEVSYLVRVSDSGIALTLSGPAPAAPQVHELWLIAGDAAPVSLGVIGTAALPLPEGLQPGMILAVSLEPAGGSPTGAPTGPVLALGPLQSL